MYDFSDVQYAPKSEQVRAWSVEQAIEFHRDGTNVGVGMTFANLISLSKMIEDFVVNGDTTSSITSAVEEGVSEGRFEVKELVESWFSDVDLDDLFRTKGWKKTEKSD